MSDITPAKNKTLHNSNIKNMKKLAKELGANWATNDILENLLNDANGDLNTACKNLIAISSAH